MRHAQSGRTPSFCRMRFLRTIGSIRFSNRNLCNLSRNLWMINFSLCPLCPLSVNISSVLLCVFAPRPHHYAKRCELGLGVRFLSVEISDRHEWLEADGLGGFASSTTSGIRTRRYHALLLTATTPPSGRLVLVNGFDAWIESEASKIWLSAQRYAPDSVSTERTSA